MVLFESLDTRCMLLGQSLHLLLVFGGQLAPCSFNVSFCICLGFLTKLLILGFTSCPSSRHLFLVALFQSFLFFASQFTKVVMLLGYACQIRFEPFLGNRMLRNQAFNLIFIVLCKIGLQTQCVSNNNNNKYLKFSPRILSIRFSFHFSLLQRFSMFILQLSKCGCMFVSECFQLSFKFSCRLCLTFKAKSQKELNKSYHEKTTHLCLGSHLVDSTIGFL
ncbi:hypothetical protein BDB00DRAFT_377079 [Zychaea mexicana]|uniref:uncharacterized protein n=1 Tax=Zychaea mexicana TaxID=64656 RepID=UPI0022FDE0D4|nr:uncharacterized protein BDB00DRAFT_377079 [Zychaea mexicana]KAI9493354.1 hypothetical protein BDB00DRAFT_377079 [Zychaea mexicana]